MKNKDGKTLLIIGTGTIGYEVIERAVLFANMPFVNARMSPFFDWGEIIFHKKTPLAENEGRIEHLLMVGDEVKAKLCVDSNKVDDFKRIMGITPSYTLNEALSKADVVIDATPFASKNKEFFYKFFSGTGKIFIAQGSEFRKGNEFGDIFIGGINDKSVLEKIKQGSQQFFTVGSCNSHAISRCTKVILDVFKNVPSENIEILPTILRRSNDSDKETTQASLRFYEFDPCYEKEGSYHTWAVREAFKSAGYGDLDIETNSIVKMPDNVMHGILWRVIVHNNEFLPEQIKKEFIEAITNDSYCTLTKFLQTNRTYGESKCTRNRKAETWFIKNRCYSHLIFSLPVLKVLSKRGCTVILFSTSTPQETNAILSNLQIASMAKNPERFNIERFHESIAPMLQPGKI